MKKPSSRIREDIARLQEQLKLAETREAERIGRVALKAGLGDIEIEDAALQAAFEDIAGRFRGKAGRATGKKGGHTAGEAGAPGATVASGADAGGSGEA